MVSADISWQHNRLQLDHTAEFRIVFPLHIRVVYRRWCSWSWQATWATCLTSVLQVRYDLVDVMSVCCVYNLHRDHRTWTMKVNGILYKPPSVVLRVELRWLYRFLGLWNLCCGLWSVVLWTKKAHHHALTVTLISTFMWSRHHPTQHVLPMAHCTPHFPFTVKDHYVVDSAVAIHY